jgi:alkanesulfonate monooxygenase
MILGAVTRGTGSHVASWRHPGTTREMLQGATSLDHYAHIAQTAERAKLHFIFLADSPVVTYQSNPAMLARAAQDYYLEPTTTLAAIAALTRHIGLVSTMSTTYSDPYTWRGPLPRSTI